MRKGRIVRNMFDYDLTDPNSAPPSGNNNQGGNTMERNYRANHPDPQLRARPQFGQNPSDPLRYVDQSEDNRPVNVVWTDRKGRRSEFTENEMTMDNPEFRTHIEQFSKPRLRFVREFWIRRNADIYRVLHAYTDQDLIEAVSAELGRRCATVDEAANFGDYVRIWYAITATGAAFRDDNGYLYPATEEEIAYATSRQQPSQATYTPPPTGNAQP